MARRRLLFVLVLVQITFIEALFFGGGGGSCSPAPSCPTNCPVCSPCGNNFYPSGGNSYGGIANYPAQQYSQPSYGFAQQSSNYASQPVASYASQPSYGFAQQANSYASQPASGYATSSYSQPQFSAILPPLISPPSYANSQPAFQQNYEAPSASVPSYQGSSVPLAQPPPETYTEQTISPSPYTEQTISSPVSYSEQPIVQPTIPSTYQPYNENTQTFEPQSTPERVTPTRGYLDVDVQPVSATTYSPNLEGYENQVTQVDAATPSSTTQQNYRDEDIDYLQPTGLGDPLLGQQNNEQPVQRRKKTKVHGIKTYDSSSRCNNEELKKVMEENITVSPSISKRRIQEAAAKQFNGTFDVVCSWDHFSYAVSTQLFCELQIKDIICFAFLHKFN